MPRLRALGEQEWVEQACEQLTDIEWCDDSSVPIVWFGRPKADEVAEAPYLLVLDKWDRSQIRDLTEALGVERLLPWNLPEQPLFGSSGLLGFEAVQGAAEAERWLEEWVEQACRQDQKLRDHYFKELQLATKSVAPVLRDGLRRGDFALLVTQQARAFGALREALTYFETALTKPLGRCLGEAREE